MQIEDKFKRFIEVQDQEIKEDPQADKGCANFGGQHLFGGSAECGGQNNVQAAQNYPLTNGSACAETIGKVIHFTVELDVNLSKNREIQESLDIQEETQEEDGYNFKFHLGLDHIDHHHHHQYLKKMKNEFTTQDSRVDSAEQQGHGGGVGGFLGVVNGPLNAIHSFICFDFICGQGNGHQKSGTILDQVHDGMRWNGMETLGNPLEQPDTEQATNEQQSLEPEQLKEVTEVTEDGNECCPIAG